MSTPLNRFNWLARNYDSLSRMVFGGVLFTSQRCFMPFIPTHANILIVGGGAGEILKHVLSIPLCRVSYVEASDEMISEARKVLRPQELDRVTFIHGTEHSLSGHETFDVIITNFFLDMFSDNGVHRIVCALHAKLKMNGLWLVTDFVRDGKWWHRLLLWTMYRFFVITCGIEASRLPSWEQHLTSMGLVETQSRFFYGRMIKSVVYHKNSSK